ncbi:MAG: DUF5780 domain-containing protein [Clostridium sp.]|nr:DUF5780 domain-containing protein [Clostridium sp.]
MICPKCQKEIPDDSLFCSGCGYSFQSAENTSKLKTDNKNVFKKLVIAICAILIIGGGVFFVNKQIQLNKVVNGFQVLLDGGKYKDALSYYEDNGLNSGFINKADKLVESKYEDFENDDEKNSVDIFNSGLLSDEYVQKIETQIVNEIEEMQNKYIAEEIEYDAVKGVCDNYKKYKNDTISSKAKEVSVYTENLNNSRNGFALGMKAIEEKKYETALANLSKVIKEDISYEAAQAKMVEVTALYKTEVMEDVQKKIESNNYSPAISSLEALKKYCSDSDVSSKLNDVKKQKEVYDKEQERIKIEGYKNNQEVEVISTRVYDDGYYIRLMRSEVIVKNNSNKTAKTIVFGLLQFDSNGYPVDVQYNMYQGTYSNELNCAFNSCNVTAGSKYGSSNYYDVPDNCRKAKACVRNVEYTDGSKWVNPYYEYWVKENYKSY